MAQKRKSEKITYEVDPHNRLVSIKSGKRSHIKEFRQVLDGEFCVGSANALSYHIKRPSKEGWPQQIKFSGSWSLNEEHNLVFTLDKWSNQCEGNQLTIKGAIVAAEDNALIFNVLSRDSQGRSKAYVLRLTGFWQADHYNRLTFNAEREHGATEKITLAGSWEINDCHQIIYAITETALKKKQKVDRFVTFKGYWDITERHRLSYILNKALHSQFDFEARLKKANTRFIMYEIGIGCLPRKRLIRLNGEWKLKEDTGVLFEIAYEQASIKAIVFGASMRLSQTNLLELKLKNRERRDLGIEVRLSRKLLGSQGERFIQANIAKGERAIFAGIGFRW